jgi:hypothetical protein
LEDNLMTRLLISAAAVSSLALGGCATTPLAGSVLPGIGTGAGAAVGAVVGGVTGLIIGGRQYYRDTRGYCYYVDQYGQPHYNYNVRC